MALAMTLAQQLVAYSFNQGSTYSIHTAQGIFDAVYEGTVTTRVAAGTIYKCWFDRAVLVAGEDQNLITNGVIWLVYADFPLFTAPRLVKGNMNGQFPEAVQQLVTEIPYIHVPAGGRKKRKKTRQLRKRARQFQKRTR